ncbi:ATP-grasp domain-containing protein [Nocardioidaceae bacterium]|nr:ATP-grasp domain-containing protein [Nocardioidaceae bacterium]
MGVSSVLIANRGEIARRVIRTCRDLGVRTVALVTEADAGAMHAREADAVAVVPSYLDVEAVVAAAREHGAAYVHPGYGFLSENAAFARALDAAGITLVGPSAEVMDQMGRKDRARDLAVEAGVPVVPQGEPETDAGFPVLVKAAAGGGGKGMRVVRSAAELDEAVAAAKREAASAFGDDTMLIERYVEHGRHLEVQVLADTHGTVVHLGDRECSAQRRHQKVLEEAPAPRLTDEVRRTVRDSAVALAGHVGYVGAGTVEFLLDDATGEVFFLEMNTRLQVEHPVTEEVSRVRGERVDLVAEQLRVAAGERLGYAQDDVTTVGHAVEVRIYAEDAYAGFLPQAGTATGVVWPDPAHHRGVRVDHALESGQTVGTGFDPMLGKVVAYAPHRDAALDRLTGALDATAITGLTTNTGFLRWLTTTPEVRGAHVETAWLDQVELEPPSSAVAAAVAALTTRPEAGHGEPFAPDGWRSGAPAAVVRTDLVATAVDPAVTQLSSAVDPGEGLTRLQVSHEGEPSTCFLRRTPLRTEVVHRGHRHVFERPDPFRDSAAAVGDGTLTAPMPGTVLDVHVAPGDAVVEGQVLVVMEAMKMELALRAPFDGEVRRVDVAVGDRVSLGAEVATVEGV